MFSRQNQLLLARLVVPLSLCLLTMVCMPLAGQAEEEIFSLQARIDQAAPGDVLTIPEGEYEGPIQVNKPIVLQASGTVVITTQNDDPVLTIDSDQVTIKGVQLLDNRINNPQATLVIRGNANRIEQVEIDTMGTGIQLRNASGNMLREIRITGHVLDPNEAAADIGHDHAAHQQLTQPVQQPGVKPRKGNGIDLLASHQNEIVANQVINMYDGIYLESSQENTIALNIVEKSRYGYHLMATSGTVLRDNTGSGNVTGAMLMDTSTATVTGNQFLKQRDNPNSQGVLLFTVTDSVLENNIIEGNRVGLYIEDSTGNTIADNELSLNFIGMQTVDSSGNEVVGNQFVSNVIQAQAQDSERNQFDGNYWDNLQALDVDGDGRSDLPFEMNPFFLALTDAVPPYQLFFQAPGFAFLESLFSAGSVTIRDTAPLMAPPLDDALPQAEASSLPAGLLGACLLLFSMTFMYIGVKRK
ncbi:nitrous oxide reductase family maturation protein NosD [Brevibacillus sp. TJ4]|uniref:right-handed parallel beta-helix repeat-containing protein n=1 Tax=Brevibacillus sp. TJ4 TaxID=3234853 RepID=UPI0037D1607A